MISAVKVGGRETGAGTYHFPPAYVASVWWHEAFLAPWLWLLSVLASRRNHLCYQIKVKPICPCSNWQLNFLSLAAVVCLICVINTDFGVPTPGSMHAFIPAHVYLIIIFIRPHYRLKDGVRWGGLCFRLGGFVISEVYHVVSYFILNVIKFFQCRNHHQHILSCWSTRAIFDVLCTPKSLYF